MSVFDDILLYRKSELLREELNQIEQKQLSDYTLIEKYKYEDIKVPAFFITSYLSDRYNGTQYQINFEFVTILGTKLTKILCIDKKDYTLSKPDNATYSLKDFTDFLTYLNSNGRNVFDEKAIQSINETNARLFEYSRQENYKISKSYFEAYDQYKDKEIAREKQSIKFDPDNHQELENWIKKLLRDFNNKNAYINNANLYSIYVLNRSGKQKSITSTELLQCENKEFITNALTTVKELINMDLVNKEYSKFIEFINSDKYLNRELLQELVNETKLLINAKVLRDYSKGIKDYVFTILDFEVFKQDWLVVCKNLKYENDPDNPYDMGKFVYIEDSTQIIVNDVEKLIELSKNTDIIIGFNNKFYDNHIFNNLIYSKVFFDKDLGDLHKFSYTVNKVEIDFEDLSSLNFESDSDIDLGLYDIDDLENYTITDKLWDMNKMFENSSALFQLSTSMITRDKNLINFPVMNYSPYKYLDTRNELMLGISLKKIEANLGLDIKESDVPFTIDRKLTDNELNEVIHYCNHDVTTTIEVLNKRTDYFKSLFDLCDTFDMNDINVTKTRASITAEILGAKKKLTRFDRDSFDYADFIKEHIERRELKDLYKDNFYSEKYGDYLIPENRVKVFNAIIEFYKKVESLFTERKKNMNFNIYNKQAWDLLFEEFNALIKELEHVAYTAEIAGVKHIFKFGGIHGAIPNYFGHGHFVALDVVSFYPFLMVMYGWLTRNTLYPENFMKIITRRVMLKREGNPLQLILKIVINATYGVLKAMTSPVCDPVNANNVCINGQLALTNLVLRLSELGTLIQSNTDGIIIETDKQNMDEIRKIYHEWEKDFKLELEEDLITSIYQRDVNNYLVRFEEYYDKKKDKYVSKVKAKGRYANNGGIKFDKNDKRCIDLAITEKFKYLTDKMSKTLNGIENKHRKTVHEIIKDKSFDTKAYLKELMYKDLTAFQILCVQGSTFVNMVHKRRIYKDTPKKEKDEIEKIKNSDVFVKSEYFAFPNTEPYEEIEYKIQKVNRGFMTTNKSYGSVFKVKAGVSINGKDYKLDDNGKPVINSLGEFEYNSFSYSKVPDISDNVLIYNGDIRNLTKDEIDALEIDLDYYVALVEKNDFLNSQETIITKEKFAKVKDNWNKITDTTENNFTRHTDIELSQIRKKFEGQINTIIKPLKEIKKHLSKAYNTKTVKEKNIDEFTDNINTIKNILVDLKTQVMFDWSRSYDFVRQMYVDIYKDEGTYDINLTIYEKRAKQLIESMNKKIFDELNEMTKTKIPDIVKWYNEVENLFTETNVIFGEYKKAYDENNKDSKKELSSKMKEIFESLKSKINKILAKLETVKNDFLKTGLDKLEIIKTFEQINSDLVLTATFKEMHTIVEYIGQSLLKQGLFSSDSNINLFIMMNM